MLNRISAVIVALLLAVGVSLAGTTSAAAATTRDLAELWNSCKSPTGAIVHEATPDHRNTSRVVTVQPCQKTQFSHYFGQYGGVNVWLPAHCSVLVSDYFIISGTKFSTHRYDNFTSKGKEVYINREQNFYFVFVKGDSYNCRRG